MELGPLQKAWVAALRQYPERQETECLGYKKGNEVKLCCLGQYLCVRDESTGQSSFEGDRNLRDGFAYNSLADSWESLGLNGSTGEFVNPDTKEKVKILGYIDLACMNDGLEEEGLPQIKWPQIAEIIEQYAHLIFTKAV